MRTSSLALAAILFLASQASAQSRATYYWQATGSNLTLFSAEQQYGGSITLNPYYTTGPNQYTMEQAFVGPLSGTIQVLWEYPTLPLRAATAHGDYLTIYFAEASTVYFWDVTTMTQLGSETVDAGSYWTYSWSNFDVPDTHTLGFVVVGADGSEAYIYLDLD